MSLYLQLPITPSYGETVSVLGLDLDMDEIEEAKCYLEDAYGSAVNMFNNDEILQKINEYWLDRKE